MKGTPEKAALCRRHEAEHDERGNPLIGLVMGIKFKRVRGKAGAMWREERGRSPCPPWNILSEIVSVSQRKSVNIQ